MDHLVCWLINKEEGVLLSQIQWWSLLNGNYKFLLGGRCENLGPSNEVSFLDRPKICSLGRNTSIRCLLQCLALLSWSFGFIGCIWRVFPSQGRHLSQLPVGVGLKAWVALRVQEWYGSDTQGMCSSETVTRAMSSRTWVCMLRYITKMFIAVCVYTKCTQLIKWLNAM